MDRPVSLAKGDRHGHLEPALRSRWRRGARRCRSGQVDRRRPAGLRSQGGVDGLLEKLRAGGLGEQVDSWVSTGAEPAGRAGAARRRARAGHRQPALVETGISIQTLLPMLAAFLPMIINHLTPNGQAPKPGEAANQPDLGGLLGGLLGGGGLGGMLGGKPEGAGSAPRRIAAAHRRMSIPGAVARRASPIACRAGHDRGMDATARAARPDRPDAPRREPVIWLSSV